MTSVSQLRGTQNYIWSLEDVLGQGATGAVYKARHKKTGELYALKVFNPMSQMRPMGVQMREFEVLKKLDHENIVRLLAIEEESTQKNKVLVMELCTEGSLHNILDNPEHGLGLPETEFLGVLRDVAAGMKHLYESGIVHRDIKPGNIMKYVGEDGKAVYKLIDFGAARELEEEEQFMSLYGTEEYLHPDMYERAVLRRPIGKQFSNTVDLWSLGVTLYHVAAGQLPFRPFGGRKNRETMYMITTEKKSGVISGVQRYENGAIEWSTELPPFCQFSKGAKLLVIPILAGLMECDPHKMWTFEQFFEASRSLLRKQAIHVFDIANCSMLHVYIDPEQRMAKLQELLAEQSDINAADQLLLFENVKFSDFCEPMELAKNYPPTSDHSPMFLFPSRADCLRLPPVPTPEILAVNTTVQLDADVSLTKMCAANNYYIRRKVNELIHNQLLLNKASNMYIVVTIRHLLQVHGFVSQFNTLIDELGRRHESTAETNRQSVQMLRMLRAHDTNGIRQELTEDECTELLMQSTSNRQIFQELRENTVMMKNRLDEYYNKLVLKKELSHQWMASLGCQPTDNCTAKMEILARAVGQTLEEFRKNKKRRKLTYNEEQIHKFEKSKLNMHMTKSLSVLQSHCDPNLRKVYRSFSQWFQNASEMRRTLENFENKLADLANHQKTLSEVLDNSQRQHTEKLRKVLDKVAPGAAAATHDASFNMAASADQMMLRENEAGPPPSVMMQSARVPKDGTYTKALVRQLNEAMKTLKMETESVCEAVSLNSEMLASLQSFQLPPQALHKAQ